MQTLILIVRLSRPLFLLGAVLVYALGAGIARYLGVEIDWAIYLLGQTWVTLLQLSTHYLNEYFDAPADAANPNRTPFSGGSGVIGPGKLQRSTALVLAVGCLTVVASLTVLLIRQGTMSPTTLFVMVLIFLGAFFYSVPPVRLASTGYGELTTSILVANLLPALAFLLQTGELHRLLAMSTFPLTALHLAMMLAFELPDYINDLKFDKKTLMVRLGWQRGMTLHNALILSAYLLLALAVSFGLPFAIAWPSFLTLPIGLLQIWQMRRVADGAKPNWTTLTITPLILFAAMTYLLAFAFWVR
jgi:1,4-dihydroxy-2-naphthoate octaprenyltransferase